MYIYCCIYYLYVKSFLVYSHMPRNLRWRFSIDCITKGQFHLTFVDAKENQARYYSNLYRKEVCVLWFRGAFRRGFAKPNRSTKAPSTKAQQPKLQKGEQKRNCHPRQGSIIVFCLSIFLAFINRALVENLDYSKRYLTGIRGYNSAIGLLGKEQRDTKPQGGRRHRVPGRSLAVTKRSLKII